MRVLYAILFSFFFIGLTLGDFDLKYQPSFYPSPFFEHYPFYQPEMEMDAVDAEAVQFRSNTGNFLLNGLQLPDVVPTSVFQLCLNPNNLMREAGKIQLLPGSAPRKCTFIISASDNTKLIQFYCKRVALGKGATLTFDGKAVEEGKTITSTSAFASLAYEDSVNSGAFSCNWRQVVS